MLPSKSLTGRGYMIEKTGLTADQIKHLEKVLTVRPAVPPSYAGTVSSFPVFLKSPTRYFLPPSWAITTYGPAVMDGRPVGAPLPSSLTFRGDLRPHQTEALAAFRAAGRNGLICLPCGYGKTFTGIAAAAEIGRCFLIVVHKEFLADQWSSELTRLLPGIRIGRIQGDKCDVGPGFDVSIAMIQTICSRSFPVGTFHRFGFALFDEVHHLAAEHFSQTLQQIQCRCMLGLTATPTRADGLSKVFSWFLGPIVYQISSRPMDASVQALALRYESDDPVYATVPVDWKGQPIRARMINQIADYAPRTAAILEWICPLIKEAGRKLLVLSDRREHLVALETGFKAAGLTDIGYYVGGMKQKDLDISATKHIILGTFAMASEGMNIPTLNAVLLATPKSAIEQSVGRILRLRPDERTVQPLILDVVDAPFRECLGQWAKRRKFYKECGYTVKWANTVKADAAVPTEVDSNVVTFAEEYVHEETAFAETAAAGNTTPVFVSEDAY